ncbi:TetR/AcrR family transcriptional regulator [Kutzneria kofuensis]|uniref:AcrR family transcriptional regulator n=1 Tax=Kutzneria kofuensis TaxID=103725 RepID=A0A7W9KN60_9PSEU|nr:TetR/AcrR family transcriptional regulator [Kutzneria kofuensis]MBB5895616.1 AcrR family transcriptional regulator [Kutzneria kofuensis]
MPYRRTPRVQARLDAQREALLAAAVALLSEQGYAGCSVAGVAARAGVSTGSVYRYFPGKAELVVEVFRGLVGREVQAVEDAANGPGDLIDRVVAIVETFANRALKAPRLAYALLAEPVDAPVEAERLVFRQVFQKAFAMHVTEAIKAGVLPAQDAGVTAAALVGAVAEVLVGPLSAGVASADTVPNLVRFTLRALGADDAAHS